MAEHLPCTNDRHLHPLRLEFTLIFRLARIPIRKYRLDVAFWSRIVLMLGSVLVEVDRRFIHIQSPNISLDEPFVNIQL